MSGKFQAAAFGMGLWLMAPIGIAAADDGTRGEAEPAPAAQTQDQSDAHAGRSRGARASRPGTDTPQHRVGDSGAASDQRKRGTSPAAARSARPTATTATESSAPVSVAAETPEFTDAAGPAPATVDDATANSTAHMSPAGPALTQLVVPPQPTPAPKPAIATVSTPMAAGAEDPLSRRLSTLLPNSFGELLSGGLLLMRRTPGRTAAPAAATTSTGLVPGGGPTPRPSAAADLATSAALNPQGTLTIRAVGAANIALNFVAPAQITVVQKKGNINQTLGTWLVGSVSRVEFIGSNSDDTFDGAAINKPMTITGNGGNDTLTGGSGIDTILGGIGDDLISGSAGADTIAGGDGNDSIFGNADNDTLLGDADNDMINGGQGLDTIYGDAGNDTLLGDTGNDTISGGIGNDTIIGGADSDTVDAGADADTVYGGTGTDTLNGGDGNDTMQGDAGNDTINGEGGADVLYGDVAGESGSPGAGNDVINGGIGNDTIAGNAGNDTLNGNSGGDTIEGGYGNDAISGEADNDVLRDRSGGNDTIVGGDGDDTIEDGCAAAYGCTEKGSAPTNILLGGRGRDNITSGWGRNTIRGNEDADTITGTSALGIDTIYGDAGDDVIRGGGAADSIFGGSERDSIWGEGGNDAITGDAGNDTVSGGADNDTVFGGADNDTLNGDSGTDTLNGDAGNDTLNGGTGNDTLNGGADNDQLHGDADNDRLSGDTGADALWGGDNVDFLLGGAGSDLLYGDGGSDTLNGNTDFDSLNGGAGDDWLVALDATVDTLEGGTGRDNFWRDRVGDGIRDFVAADDVDNAVIRFANGADLSLDGDAIQRGLVPLLPTRNFASNPLFAANGPTGSDVRVTGRAGTTWGAQLAALADGADAGVSASWLIRQAMVDFGDGTYGLKLGGSFYRVDGMLPGNAQGPSYAGLGAQNSIWVNIAMKGIVTALSQEGAIQPGSLNYGLLTDPGQMGPTKVFEMFGENQQRARGTTGGANSPLSPANLRGALDMFQRGYSYLTVSLADSGDSNVNQGVWQRGTLGRKFATFYGIAPAQPPASTPMVYSVSAVETVNGQVTAVILRNPTGSDTGGSDMAVSYRDANTTDGLVRITVAELLTSAKGPRLSWLSTGR